MFRRLKRHEDGASAVEFALVSIPLILLLVGIIQFGFLFFQWLEITHAAREGARWAALGRPDSEVVDKVRNAAPGLGDRLSDDQIDIVPAAGSVLRTVGNPVTVAVEWDAKLFHPVFQSALGVDGFTFPLRSAATLRIE